MAVKMKLVPETWLEDIERGSGRQEKKGQFAFLHELPDEYKAEASEVLRRAIDSGLSLTTDNRVKYKGGFVGSNIVDLLNYVLNLPNKPRPTDSEEFLDALSSTGYYLGTSSTFNKSINMGKNPKWKSLSKRL